MKAILVKAEVWRRPNDGKAVIDYRWLCRMCGKRSTTHSLRWNYIARLGVGHMERMHGATEHIDLIMEEEQ